MSTVSLPNIDSPRKTAKSARESTWLWAAIALWLAAVGVGWWVIANYEFRWQQPDTSGAIANWPAGTELPLAADRPTVLFFMHPKCPCTRASLNQFARLWTLTGQDASKTPQLLFVVTVPFGAADDWYESPTVKQSNDFAGATQYVDRDGIEARRFGVATSGTVMWFDKDGRRLYSGGVTPSRGHEGDSPGGDAVAGLIRGSRQPAYGLPAFGCRLCLPSLHESDRRINVHTALESTESP